MTIRNKLSLSYGLIVKTECNRVVVIKRKVPYCVQNYFHYLHKERKRLDVPQTVKSFKAVQSHFETHYLPKLSAHDRMEYEKFQAGKPYEDMYDFPHGQSTHRHVTSRRQMFYEAFREFREETGFTFQFKSSDIDEYPLFGLEFLGLDNCWYTQYYFVVENVKGLRRKRLFDSYTDPDVKSVPAVENWTDDHLVYRGELIRAEEAYQLLLQQQDMKRDFKHELCLDHQGIFNKMPKCLPKSCLKEKAEIQKVCTWSNKAWLLNKIN